MPAEPPEGRKVKSRLVDAGEATDRHERAKDYLSPAEMTRLLAAAAAKTVSPGGRWCGSSDRQHSDPLLRKRADSLAAL